MTVALVGEDERLAGAVALGSPKVLNRLRPTVAERATVDDARELVVERVPR